MKSFKRLLAFAIASAACGVAQADATYETSFNLGGPLPQLRNGASAPVTPGTLGGYWIREVQQDARIISRDLLSESVDPVTGEVSRTWGPTQYDENRDRGGVGPWDVGDTKARTSGPNEFTSTTGGAYVGQRSVGTNLTTREHEAESTVSASWSKGFSLDAHSSFSFSGIALLSVTGDAEPANASTTFALGGDGSFASLTLADASDRLWTRIGASVAGVAGSLAGIFSYDIGPGGFLSLTITNNSDVSMAGRVSIDSFIGLSPGAAVAAPVPEPETVLMLLSGLALVGVAKRKRSLAQEPVAA